MDARPRKARDDPAGHRLADPERVADGKDQIADLNLIRIAQGERGQIRRPVHAQDRQIAFLIRQNHGRVIFPPVVQNDADFRRLAHHVKVRHHQPVRRHDHTGPEGILNPRHHPPLPAKQVTKERIVGKGADAGLDHAFGIDVHHGGRGGFDHGGKGQADVGL